MQCSCQTFWLVVSYTPVLDYACDAMTMKSRYFVNKRLVVEDSRNVVYDHHDGLIRDLPETD